MTCTFVVTDPHGHPEDDFSRFDWLGRALLEEKPDNLVVMGDWGRFDSLSRHGDTPATTFRQDLEAMHEALRRTFGPLAEWNKSQRSHRHRQHAMRTVWLEGNHEERARRVAKEDPHGFASLVDWEDPFGLARWYDERYEYGEYANVNGVYYTHTPRNIMGRAASWTAACKGSPGHLFFGHTHSMRTETIPLHGTNNAVKLIASCPAYMPDQNKEPYCSKLTTGWTYGMLKVYPRGSPTIPPSFDWVDMDRMEQRYG